MPATPDEGAATVKTEDKRAVSGLQESGFPDYETEPDWSVVLSRFSSSASVERLVNKKQRELESLEFSQFMEAVIRRMEEIAREED